MTTIRCKLVKDLTTEEYKACYRTNFGSHGDMRAALGRVKAQNILAYAVMIWIHDELAAWALVFDESYIGPTAYFYTKNIYRRKGYGFQIAQYIQERFGQVQVIPTTKRNISFFNKMGMHHGTGGRRYYI
jgi:hypothetical protein